MRTDEKDTEMKILNLRRIKLLGFHHSPNNDTELFSNGRCCETIEFLSHAKTGIIIVESSIALQRHKVRRSECSAKIQRSAFRNFILFSGLFYRSVLPHIQFSTKELICIAHECLKLKLSTTGIAGGFYKAET